LQRRSGLDELFALLAVLDLAWEVGLIHLVEDQFEAFGGLKDFRGCGVGWALRGE
jgi:hypothetical protein